MKKYKKAHRLAALLVSVLMVDSFQGAVSPYINSYAYTERTALVNATTLNVRSGPGTTYSVVTKLANGAGVTVVNEAAASDGALWYQIRFSNSSGQSVTGYVSKSYLKFPVSYTQDGDFESQLSTEGFPESYKIRLRQLHAEFPNWRFKAQHTNLDWNTAVKEESKVGKSLVHTNSMSSWKSMADGAYNWDTSSWVGYDGSSWVTASEDIVKYYMDPRNFLDETNIFQFLTHSYDSNSHTMEGLNTMIKGTFLQGQAAGGGSSSPGGSPVQPGGTDNQSGQNNNQSGGASYGPGGVIGPGAGLGPSGGTNSEGSGPDNSGTGEVSLEGPPQASVTRKNAPVLMEYGPGASLTGPSASADGGTVSTVSGSYGEIIMNAATQSGVNPYVLAAMIIQEQGSGGTGKSISGTEPGYVGFYNFFNIEAYQSGSMSAVQRGLWWASQPGSYERPWNSPQRSILGGALYYGNNYVKVGQDTFYLKKFNVQGSNLYKHQYMTNVQGAASEGGVYAKAYNDEMKKTALEFKIPVYNNMPDNACSQPTGDGNPNNKLAGLSVDGFVMTPTFSRDTLEYNLIVDPSVSSIRISASALNSAASVSGTGTITLQSGNNDIKVIVTAQNGTIREYILHVVRQAGGSVNSDPGGAPDPSGTGGSPSGSSASGGMVGPGVSNSSAGGNEGTPGGSAVAVAPDGSGSMSAQNSGPVLNQPPGSNITIPEQTQPETQKNPTETLPAQNTTPSASSGQPSYAFGDVNGDGKVSSLDVLKLKRHILGLESLPAASHTAADLNGDGKINPQDLLLLQKKVLGL